MLPGCPVIRRDMYQAAVFIHLASAIIWIGGSLFLALVLIPVMRRYAPAPGQPPVLPADMLGSMARRFRWISWVCIVLLVATGLYILPTRYGIGFGDFFSLGGHFVATLQVKVALVAVVIWAQRDARLRHRAVHQSADRGDAGGRRTAGLPAGIEENGGVDRPDQRAADRFGGGRCRDDDPGARRFSREDRS